MSALSEFLNMTVDEAPVQELLPDGTYIFTVQGYKAEEVGEKKTPKISFRVKPIEIVQADLEEDKLRLAKPVRMDFFATEAAMAQASASVSVVSFVKMLGLDESGVKFQELLEFAIGKRFKGIVKRKMEGKNKDIPVASIVRAAPEDV